MPELSYSFDDDVDARTALARGAGVLHAGQPALYGAIARDEALVLGRWQRGAGDLRRASGGPTARIGPGVLYLALGLPHPSALMECPRDRVLNRNVRGLLGGLGALAGAPVLYFGREWLSLGKTPVALVGWHRDLEGRVLLECFVSIGAPFAPPRDFRGHAPGSIVIDVVLGAAIETIARGHASRYPGVAITRGVVPLELAPPSSRDDVTAWSASYEVPIGTVQAGVSLDHDGHIARARIAGDFFAEQGAMEALETDLVGLAPDAVTLGRALDHALGPGRGVIEGVTSLRTLQGALLEAARG